MAIFQFAIVLQSQIGLTNAVREAARREAATEPTTNPIWANEAAWVQGQLCGDTTPPCTSGLLEDNVPSFDGTLVAPDPPTVSFCRYLVGTENNYRVNASVTYRHPLFFGLLAFATDAVDGTQDGRWTLSASAEMRLENIDDTVTGFNDPGVCT